MKKLDNRIDLKDKSGWVGLTILLVTFIFFFYLSYDVLVDFISYETGICKKCFGPLKQLNNPIPFIFLLASYLGTNYFLFKFILKSKYIDSPKKNESTDEELSTKSNIYIFLITAIIAGILLFVFGL